MMEGLHGHATVVAVQRCPKRKEGCTMEKKGTAMLRRRGSEHRLERGELNPIAAEARPKMH